MADETNPAPHWQTDFPIERTEATAVSRRDFARYLCLVSGGLAAGSGFVALKAQLAPPAEVVGEHLVCKVNDVPTGGTHAFVIAGSTIPYILIRLESGEWRAYEQKCTHLSCAVYYKPGTGQIECPCHNGFFDARTGEPIAGPPPRPLPSLEVVVKGEDIYVKAFRHE
ncbi:Rieske (2Fe-2S) protein [Paraflavitalea sp. CAU 1676]|uniref:Rieske (2Fe-2S) protein n=1 Tax=Paraflavitalea sp. CAU 1676 TaxID=3032598 RepID=UPI0023DB3EC6|nr:Rieske (2Fe-2S) protein [Paraflavitalea sp. CAU 1676]MDF2190611.1 Rieske (2Fe-2S) protein [Paraflavitalea sp. CAU 1676]